MRVRVLQTRVLFKKCGSYTWDPASAGYIGPFTGGGDDGDGGGGDDAARARAATVL